MKIIAIVGLVLLVPVGLFACPKGSVAYQGTCAVDLVPAESAVGDNASWVSDEKPPKTTTGEWQTGKFQIIQLKSQTIDDEIASKQAWDAAHGIKDKIN